MKLVRGCLVLGICLVSPLAMVAGQATKKFDLVPGKTQTVTVEVDSVRVSQVVLDIENAGGKGPLKKSGAEAEVRMDNNGAKSVEAGIAVVLLDGAGNVVAAGSCGTKMGWLKAGERDTCKADFPYVYRNLKGAKSMMVTLETREKTD